MNGVNLFQQQAEQERNLRAVFAAADREVEPAPPLGVARFIQRASLDQCRMVAFVLSDRLFALHKQHGGMKAANLEEAARLTGDAALDIDGALNAADEEACACGRCDSCVAARSDEHHDRRVDGLLARQA